MPLVRSKKKPGGFVQVDKCMLYDNRLSHFGRVLGFVMLDNVDTWKFHQRQLAEKLNCSESTIRRGVAELRKLMYITGDFQNGTNPSTITLYENPNDNPVAKKRYGMLGIGTGPLEDALKTAYKESCVHDLAVWLIFIWCDWHSDVLSGYCLFPPDWKFMQYEDAIHNGVVTDQFLKILESIKRLSDFPENTKQYIYEKKLMFDYLGSPKCEDKKQYISKIEDFEKAHVQEEEIVKKWHARCEFLRLQAIWNVCYLKSLKKDHQFYALSFSDFVDNFEAISKLAGKYNFPRKYPLCCTGQ